ncbi:type II toxin-antitoxin system RelB/DinJ family antitoxin [Methylorubrum extorquens]|uniref:type II toxin-antitoxin system RelB/DinJ family antitoxin n=1 Tax=Methylorubrum extorquens TaxID=408 RepID=UPI0020A06722|nr:type II toxin-antitoxin system RelB/DinJ family antitoxin [Methylorubrum extorquens]MCP1538339.1 DNA-damage-inducible protein J [Methylorubrum extorquens]
MPTKSLIQARIDADTKEEATAVLKAMGLTVSDAVRMMLVRVAREKALPFEPLVPNETTIAAIREARSGNLPGFTSVEALIADLDADD